MKYQWISWITLLSVSVLSAASFGAPGEDETVPDYSRWAAAAFSRQRAGTGQDPVGRAYSESSEYVAKDTAIRACHASDCEIKVYVNAGCIGIAQGTDVNYWSWWGFGSSAYARMRDETISDAKLRARKSAREMAKAACDSATHSTHCNITQDYCTWDPQAPNTAQDVQNWIIGQGGEQDPRVRGVVQLVNVAAQSYLLNLGLTYDKTSCLGSRRWARVVQFAVQCGLSVDDLDRLYADANRYDPGN